MPRVTVPAAEALIGHEFPCLNLGHVMLVDYMGGDLSVVQAARTSYAKDLQPFDEEKDSKLIQYLMAHRHTTPFEMVDIKVRMKLPIFVARQWIRHRTASLNEESARYSQLKDEFYVPEASVVKMQSDANKQGRGQEFPVEIQMGFREEFRREQAGDYADYDRRIQLGMAKELARINLPVSVYTNWYWKQNLWNMLHLLGLRMDPHAQYEIRVYANALYEIVKAVAPISLAAWEDHMFKGARFSRTEMDLLMQAITKTNNASAAADLKETVPPVGWLHENLAAKLGKRGADEFLEKFRKDYGA